jgi:hypothetical protein
MVWIVYPINKMNTVISQKKERKKDFFFEKRKKERSTMFPGHLFVGI